MTQSNPIGHVTSPYVIGGAVIALKCKEGVVIGTDTLLSYGSLLKYSDVTRYEKVTDNVVIAASGEYADFQEVGRQLKHMAEQNHLYDDQITFSTKDYANYLAHICYQKRNKFNPFFNNIVIAGHDNDQSFLASVDLYGALIKKDYITTGFAKHFGLSLIANEWSPSCSVQQCMQVIRKCFKVIYLRDCHSIDQIQFSVVSKEGVDIRQPEKLDVNSQWDIKQFRDRANEKLWQ